MSKSRKILPYLVIVILSLAIIVAAWFIVPTMFENDKGNDNSPTVDNGDANFINSLGGVSETYVGAVSTESYSSVEKAAKAYINNEIAGKANSSVLKTETVQEFAPSNVDIQIPSEFLEGADSVEKVNVTYNIFNVSTYSSKEATESTDTTEYTVVVYVIKYGPDFKYFVPMPVTGETISKSYYDSVFNSDKWSNCTMEVSSSIAMGMEASYQGETVHMTMNIDMYQYVKYDNGKIYMHQKMTSTTNSSEMGMNESEETSIYALIIEDEYGDLICYYKENEDDAWQRGYLYNIGFNKIEELEPFYNDYLDYTYFSKTSYGFALEKENAKQYFMQAFGALAGDFTADVDFGSDGIDMTVRYYVRDGVLTGLQNDTSINVDVSEDGVTGSIEVNVDQTATCTNYGTTVVEIPDEIK